MALPKSPRVCHGTPTRGSRTGQHEIEAHEPAHECHETDKGSQNQQGADGGFPDGHLASRDAQDAAQLTAASGLSPTEMIQQLLRLTEQGFIIAGRPDDAGVGVYRLNPKGERTDGVHPNGRILLVDDADALRGLMTLILEDEGYVVIATALQADALALLREVDFDLVITDSFSPKRQNALINSAELLAAAGDTPVALFSGHRMELAPAQAAGFRDLIEKPFDIDALSRQVRTLLAH